MTVSLIHSSLSIVIPSIVILSKDGVLDPLDWANLMYAAFHRSMSPRILKSLSFTKLGFDLLPFHSVSSLRATLVSFQDGAVSGDLVEYGRHVSTFSSLPSLGTCTTKPLPHK